jgi:hypothetical protein
MVNRQTRRTLRKPVNFSEQISGDSNGERIEARSADTGDEPESGTEPDTDSGADGDDNESPIERDEPSGNVPIGVVEVDPANLGEFIARGGADSGRDSTRKRGTRSDAGKPRGTRRRKETPQNLDVVINMVHTMAAVMTHTPELKLDPEEVKEFSSVYSEFCAYHDVPVLTPKRMSEVALVAFAFKIYGPRFIAVRNRIKRDAKQRAGFGVHDGGRQAQHPPVM